VYFALGRHKPDSVFKIIISLMPANFMAQECYCLCRQIRRLQRGGLPVSLPLKGFVTVALN
ncbi:MAG: hypothetical protein WCG44_03475, partial [bacterium]